uniref:Uncharacterized protein n=1 Tax=Anguilla anguilla TaxID=7936 RepID=A0A0E9QEE3_ANGAN
MGGHALRRVFRGNCRINGNSVYIRLTKS